MSKKDKKKPRKPPVDRKALVQRLDRARSGQLQVHVRRWIPYSDRLSGFVVGLGDEWFALQTTADLTLDSWSLLRLADLQAVSVDPNPDAVTIRALRSQQLWPVAERPVDLDSTPDVVRSLGDDLVAVFDEFYDPDKFWMGRVLSVDDDVVSLRELSPGGRWERDPFSRSLDSITRFDIGGIYQDNLERLAGPPPADD